MSKRIISIIVLIAIGIILGSSIGIYLYVNFSKTHISSSEIEEAILMEDLVGFWHASPHPAAAYNDHFKLFADGTFVFVYDQYDGESRNIDFSGRWEILDGNLLSLIIEKKTKYVGGLYTKDITSETTDHVLVGGKSEEYLLDEPQTIIYPLEEYKREEEYEYPITIKIGGIKYWKLGSH